LLEVYLYSLSLSFFYLRKRRKDKFDGRSGNLDHRDAYVKGGGSGTTPKIDLEEDDVMNDNEVRGDEDDGMRGRLGDAPEGGGIITPYPFHPAPLGGTAVSGQQSQHQPHMRQISNTAVAADGVGAGLAAGHPNGKRARQRIHAIHTSEPSSPIPNQQDPFVLSPSSGGEPEPGQEELEHLLTSSPTAVPFQLPRAGTAVVVVHEDGGRVVLRKGEDGEGEPEGEVLITELPPTYDSLPHDVRRDG